MYKTYVKLTTRCNTPYFDTYKFSKWTPPPRRIYDRFMGLVPGGINRVTRQRQNIYCNKP